MSKAVTATGPSRDRGRPCGVGADTLADGANLQAKHGWEADVLVRENFLASQETANPLRKTKLQV